MVKAIIFDFDGTLVDTLFDLQDAINFALKENGFNKTYSYEETKYLIGKGIRVLCSRALSYTNHTIEDEERVYRDFYKFYTLNQINKTRPYKGVIETIKKIKNQGIKVAILSNKKESNLIEIVNQLFPLGLFDIAMGKRDEFALKPNPNSLLYLINELGVSKEDVLYVGDSDVDMEVAINAGIKKIAVTYGYREREVLEKYCPEYFVGDIKEILRLLINN